MQWCRKKGFAPPRRYRPRSPRGRYERGRDGARPRRDRRQGRRGGLEDILLGRYISGRFEQERLRRRRDLRLTEPRLGDLIGRYALEQLKRRGRRLDLGTALSGRLVRRGGAQVLRVTAGPQVLAELVDSDRDGRADRILLARRAGER